MPFIMIACTTFIAIAASIYCLLSDWTIIFQNLLYIPIIIACVYYTKKGFVFSIGLSFLYLLLIIVFTYNSIVIMQAIIRVCLFIFIAGVTMFLSIKRKSSEEVQWLLHESEERYRTVADFTYNWEYWLAPDGTLKYISPSCERITGYTMAEFLKDLTLISKIIHPDDRKKFDAHIQSILTPQDKDDFHEIDLKIITKNGKERWIAHVCRRVYSSDGEYLGRRISNLDITDRKQAEEKITGTLSLLESTMESTTDGIMVADGKGGIVFFNKIFKEMWTIPEVIIATKNDNIAISFVLDQLKEPEIFLKSIHDLCNAPEITSFDVLELKDGRVFERYSQPRRIGNSTSGRVWSFRDITKRKHAEHSLFAEKELLAVTLLSIGDGVITTDTDGRVKIMNSVAEMLTGWSQMESAGKPLTEVFHIVNEQTGESYENPAASVLKYGKTVELSNHTILISRDGSKKVIADSGAPIRNLEGDIIGVVLVFRDMTDKQKSLDNQLRVQKLESIGILAGGIAHDFNNLLSIIYGNLELMESAPDKETAAQYLANCIKTMKHAKAITLQLLTFAKGGAPIKKIGNIVPFIQDSVQFALSGSKCVPVFNIEKNLWAMEYDENQMGQVINNIVINATQAMPNGGKLEVTAANLILQTEDHSNLPAGKYVKMSFKDNGIGIPKELLTRIFDPYFTTKQTGRGLGLASVYSIIQQHDGYIEVESEAGKGAAFHVYLPASTKPPLDTDLQSIPILQGKGKILMMDDEANLREVLMQTLTNYGYSVFEAANGSEVLKILSDPNQKNDPFTGVILDLTIPGGMGGKETAAEIKKIAPDLPIFVYSGYSDDPVMVDPEKYGFSGSLNKPYKREELITMLQKGLNRK